MSTTDFCLIVAHVYLARSLNPFAALCMATFWFIFAWVR